MFLGTSSPLAHSTPEEWAEKHKSLGLKTVNFPVDCTVGEEKIMAYKKAADTAGLTIAEVGIWRNKFGMTDYFTITTSTRPFFTLTSATFPDSTSLLIPS